MPEPKQPEFDELVPPVLVDRPIEYVSDGRRLLEVLERSPGWIRVRDCVWPFDRQTLAVGRVREVIPEPDFDSLR